VSRASPRQAAASRVEAALRASGRFASGRGFAASGGAFAPQAKNSIADLTVVF
jgi:hypothetical protein